MTRVVHPGGFTLLELLTTLAVAAIIATVAVPGMQRLMQDVRISTSANRFVAALQLARSEAIRRGERVSVCAVDASAQCQANGLGSGWGIVPGDDPFGAGTPVIRVFDGVPPGVLVRYHFGNVPADYISYLPTGETRRLNGSLLMGSVRFCDAREGRADRRIIISATGRPRVEAMPCD